MYVYKPTQPTIPPIALTNARNVILLTLYGGQFTLSTQLIILHYLVLVWNLTDCVRGVSLWAIQGYSLHSVGNFSVGTLLKMNQEFELIWCKLSISRLIERSCWKESESFSESNFDRHSTARENIVALAFLKKKRSIEKVTHASWNTHVMERYEQHLQE